jgi:outer membrane protein assembly factor BamB
MTNSINQQLRLVAKTCLAAMLLSLPLCLQEKVTAQQSEQQRPEQLTTDGASPTDSPLEDLNYATIRVPAAEDFLHRLPAGDLPESSFQTLHEIFSLADDAFLIDLPAGRWTGLRQTAIEKLRAAGFSAQQAWNRTAIASAESAWNDAVSRGDVTVAVQIAASWPLSEYDLRLTLLQALEAWHAGESAAAAAAISRTLERCRGTALESRAVSLLQPLEKRLQAHLAEVTPPALTAPVRAVSAPWPRPLWRWRELVRQKDSERQQAESTLLLSMDPDTAARMRSFELWKPMLWGPWIITRAPSRLVALDRRTGAESWWLDTDQALRDPSAPHHEDDSGEVIWQSSPGNPSGIIDAKLDTRWGVLAADHECLWLVDRLPVFSGLDPQSNPFARGRLNPWLPDELQPDTGNLGTRLVCLRRPTSRGADTTVVDLPPEIAWISGEGFWKYRVATPATVDRNSPANPPERDGETRTSGDMEPTADMVDETSSPQLFASGPAVTGNRLVILCESPQNEQLDVLCLNRLTGQTIWRQPLLQLSMLHALREAAGGVCQSVCFVCGDTAICSLEGSILAAVDLWDGHCRWMLPLKRIHSADAGLFPMMFEDGQMTAGVPTRCPFLPVANENIVICAAPNSAELQAIEAQTGRVLWKVPRIVSGSVGPGGSPDLLAAGLFENHVILVGERHCRSLDLAEGNQLWIVETGLCSGSPLCSATRIVLPQLDGRPVVVDLNRGRQVEQSELFLPSGAGQLFGAVTGDDQCLFSGTAGVITAWPRADRVTATGVEIAGRPATHAFSSTEQIQALLLNGDRDAAKELTNKLQLPTELLSEAWLLERGHQLENSPPSVVEAATLPPAEIVLTPSQQLRLQLIEAVAAGRSAAVIQSHDRRLQQLSSAWSVSLSALQPIALPQPFDAAALQSLALADLRRLAESACLHPADTASPQSLDLLVEELSRRGLSEAAELVAAAWWLEATAGGENFSGAEQAALRLHEIRGLAREVEASSVDGLQSSSLGPLTATALLQLRSTDAAAADPEGEDLLQAAPWWLPRDMRLAVASETGRSLLVMDRAGAGLLEQFPNEAGWKSPSITFRQTSRQLSVPSLIPVLNESQLQLAAVQADGRIRILWSRELPGAAVAMPEPQVGPLWPGGLIVHSGDHLLCLHPLTGQLLWKRRLPQEFDYSGLLHSRLFGDQQAVVLLGSDGASIESFRSSDGRPLGRGPVQIGRGTECGTVGRFLIHTDLAYRLHILDGATGEDRLQREPPVILAATHTESLFAALPGDRILTITADGELVLVDLQAGRQVFRTKLPPSETMAAVSSIQAVESGGRLLVEVENTGGAAAGGFGAALNMPFRQQPGMGMLGLGGIGEELRRTPRGAALEIDDGLLCCLDAVTGQLLWVQSRYDCRVQRVAGDPTDLVVLTEVRFGRSEDPDGGLAQHVNLEVLHAQTGEVLLRAGKIAMTGIHASWHDAGAAEIRLVGTDGVVVIRRSR